MIMDNNWKEDTGFCLAFGMEKVNKDTYIYFRGEKFIEGVNVSVGKDPNVKLNLDAKTACEVEGRHTGATMISANIYMTKSRWKYHLSSPPSDNPKLIHRSDTKTNKTSLLRLHIVYVRAARIP